MSGLIKDEAPWMIPLFVDSNYPNTHKLHSNQKTLVKCPTCGLEKKMSAEDLFQLHHVTCGICSDGISFPNKIMRYILLHSNVNNLTFEYSPKWANRKLYDTYFEHNSNKYVVEMDGAFHYYENRFNGGRSLQETIFVDKEKDNLAQLHGINVIRIDCKESDFSYIKDNIIKSELLDILELDNINWQDCASYSSKSIVGEVWNYYKEHNYPTLKEVADYFHISTNTAMRYLRRGNDCGLIEYKNDRNRGVPKGFKRPFRHRKYDSGNVHNALRVSVFDSNKTLLGVYGSVGKSISDLNEKYNLSFKEQSVYSARNRHKDVSLVKYKDYYFSFEEMEVV